MMHPQSHSCGFKALSGLADAQMGASLPMGSETARELAEISAQGADAIASNVSVANSQNIARRQARQSTDPRSVGSWSSCYPSQSSRSGYVPTAPAALFFAPRKVNNNARQIADCRPIRFGDLPLRACVALSVHTQKTYGGKSRCDFLKLQRSPVSRSVGWRPVETQRLNRACLALVQGQAQPLSLAATPKPQPSSAREPMCFTARPIQTAATDLTSAPALARQNTFTIKVLRDLGGFLLPRRHAGPARLNGGPNKEGTSDVQ